MAMATIEASRVVAAYHARVFSPSRPNAWSRHDGGGHKRDHDHLQQAQEKISGESEDRTGGQSADARGGGDDGTGQHAEDQREEDAGGIGPGIFHRTKVVLTAEGAEGTEE
jgi:hypothetical protein